jgi:hypothetical protein
LFDIIIILKANFVLIPNSGDKMNKKNGYCTSPRRDGKWSVKRNGSAYVKSVHGSQTSAWKEARRLARGEGSAAILLDRNGLVETQNTYLDDTSNS